MSTQVIDIATRRKPLPATENGKVPPRKKPKLTEKREEDGKGVVVCQVWAENQRGEHTTTGDATIELPLRRNE